MSFQEDCLTNLEIFSLKKENERLNKTIVDLKERVEALAIENCHFETTRKKKRALAEETKEKWTFYHREKKRIYEEMLRESNQPPMWYQVKRQSDKECILNKKMKKFHNE